MTVPTEPAAQGRQPAGVLRRLGALVYDGLLVLAILFLATALALVVVQGQLDYTNPWFRVYLLLVIFGFFAWFWTHGGQTLGMRAWKIRVEQLDGAGIGWGQAAIRFLVSLATLGLGLLWVPFDRQKQALYDRVSKTRVIVVEPRYVPNLT